MVKLYSAKFIAPIKHIRYIDEKNRPEVVYYYVDDSEGGAILA